MTGSSWGKKREGKDMALEDGEIQQLYYIDLQVVSRKRKKLLECADTPGCRDNKYLKIFY